MLQTEPKERLIRTAIDLFGRTGLDGVGTRAIADAAGVQMSTITYYFGGKDGLHLACAEHIAATMRARTAPLLADIHQVRSVKDARLGVESILAGMVGILMSDEVGQIARFIVREQMNPSPAFAILYDGAMRFILEALTNLLEKIGRGRLSKEEAKVRSFALIGQVLAFRVARAALMRSTGWAKIAQRETELARNAVLVHTRAVLADLERKTRS